MCIYAPVKDINSEGNKKSLKHMVSLVPSVSSSMDLTKTSESTSMLLPIVEGSTQPIDSLDLDVPSTSKTDTEPADIEIQPTTVDDPNEPADTELVVSTQAAHQPIMSATLDLQVEDWGCEHEEAACNLYKSMHLSSHHDFVASDCGFYINTDHSFIGASPDGLVKCTCYGEGICEIKVVIVMITK